MTVAVRRADGSIEQVRVGTAVKQGDGFALRLGDLRIGAAEAPGAYRSAAPASASAPAASMAGGLPTTLPNYGRSKGAPIYGASMQDLEYYANGSRRSLADPSKARWHDKERAMLAALEAEMARQRGEQPPMEEPGALAGPGDVPPPGDEDEIPF